MIVPKCDYSTTELDPAIKKLLGKGKKVKGKVDLLSLAQWIYDTCDYNLLPQVNIRTMMNKLIESGNILIIHDFHAHVDKQIMNEFMWRIIHIPMNSQLEARLMDELRECMRC